MRHIELHNSLLYCCRVDDLATFETVDSIAPAAAQIARDFLIGNPQNLAVTRVMANMMVENRDWNAAGLYLDRLIAQTQGRDIVSLRQMGLVWLERRDPRNAYPYLLRAYQLVPANAETSSLLGLAIAQRGDNPKAALALQEKAVTMAPDNAIYAKRLAEARKVPIKPSPASKSKFK
jgi:predicted Zn-dependent protease